MVDSTGLARGTLAIVLFGVLISGPFVPFVDFTVASEPSSAPASASVSVETAPDGTFLISTGRFGTGTYLYSPDVVVRVHRVTGAPILVYELAIPRLGFNIASVAFLDEGDGGRDLRLGIEPSRIEATRVSDSSYAGELSVRVRTENASVSVYRQNVTVPVEGADAG